MIVWPTVSTKSKNDKTNSAGIALLIKQHFNENEHTMLLTKKFLVRGFCFFVDQNEFDIIVSAPKKQHYKSVPNIKIPLLGIYFLKNAVKTLLLGRDCKKFLKMFAQLITFKIWKVNKKYFKILPKGFTIFYHFS